jgi:hypothetical protein
VLPVCPSLLMPRRPSLPPPQPLLKLLPPWL